MPNLNKFNAYKYVADNYSDAVNLIISKGLVLGEPAVVPYYLDQTTKDVRIVLGIGSLDGKVEIFNGDPIDTSTAFRSIIYYGAGTQSVDVMQHSVISSTPYRMYTIEVTDERSNIMIAVPATMPSLRFEVDGNITPTTTENITINGIDYILYTTVEAFSEGTYFVRVLNEFVEDSIVLVASPNMIYVGNPTNVSLIAKCSTSADRIVIYDASNNVLADGSGTFVQTTEVLSAKETGKITFRATASFSGNQISAETTVTAVLVIYYGSGQNYTDATNELQKESPCGRYDFNLEHDGDKFFLLIPANLTVDSITMNGFEVPMSVYEVQVNGRPYFVYESVNGYTAGNYVLMVNTPHDHEPVPGSNVIWYGCGSTYTDVTRSIDADTPQGRYSMTVNNDGEKFFFLIPPLMDINAITMNGFDVPMKPAYNGMLHNVLYEVYESTNGYRAGLYNLTVY